jgi:hypothetical protein
VTGRSVGDSDRIVGLANLLQIAMVTKGLVGSKMHSDPEAAEPEAVVLKVVYLLAHLTTAHTQGPHTGSHL